MSNWRTNVKRIDDCLRAVLFALALGVSAVQASEAAPKGAPRDLVSTWHYVMHTELKVDHPLSEVWPVFKDMRRWYTEYTFEEVISGPPYESPSGLLEDQVLKLGLENGVPSGFPGESKTHGATERPEFIMKTLKVIPQKEIVVALWGPAHSIGWKRYTTFYVWKMNEIGNQTSIFVDSYGQVELAKPLHKAEFSKYYEAFASSWQRSWRDAFINFREVLGEAK
jgi:hypothetical protein